MKSIASYLRPRRLTFLLAGLAALVLVLVGVAFGHSAWALAAGAVPFALGTAQTDNDVVRVLIACGCFDAAAGIKRRITVKTADYTILSPATAATGDPSGTIFTNRGAVGAVIFTLPAAAAALAGVFYEFLGIADQNITVVTPVADTLLVVNDIAADSLAVSTASHKIGAHMRFICDGVAWCAYGDSVGDTFTVAT